MAVADIQTTGRAQEPTITDRIADAVRHATHLSHEARLVTSVAKDAREEGIHAAKRLIKRVRRTAESFDDLKDDAAYYVKRQPFKALAIAAAAGVLLGVTLGWIGATPRRRHMRQL
jgi:ElaB/YqjD/DUF883 family membrane-anchored ribosome-binding protein